MKKITSKKIKYQDKTQEPFVIKMLAPQDTQETGSSSSLVTSVSNNMPSTTEDINGTAQTLPSRLRKGKVLLLALSRAKSVNKAWGKRQLKTSN